jgi:hypothetical protein
MALANRNRSVPVGNESYHVTDRTNLGIEHNLRATDGRSSQGMGAAAVVPAIVP